MNENEKQKDLNDQTPEAGPKGGQPANEATDADAKTTGNKSGGKGAGRGKATGGQPKAKGGVRAVCIKKRQWKGRIIHPRSEEVFTFENGIPEGYEDFFQAIS